MNTGMSGLPEPADLQALLAARRPLDWGEELPTTAEIAARYGERTAERSLQLLTEAAASEPRITDAVLSAIGAEASSYHLQNRIKSPHSLAGKLARYDDFYRRSGTSPDDVLRYTAAVDHPDELTEAAVRTIDRLTHDAWEVTAAHHSYIDGSRYKGLHVLLRTAGQKVELQVHSSESIGVKERTTRLYEVERDPEQPATVRKTARSECIRLSAGMTQPAGIDDLAELGGVPVKVIGYGMNRQQHGPASGPKRVSEPARAPEPTRHQARDLQNGASR